VSDFSICTFSLKIRLHKRTSQKQLWRCVTSKRVSSVVRPLTVHGFGSSTSSVIFLWSHVYLWWNQHSHFVQLHNHLQDRGKIFNVQWKSKLSTYGSMVLVDLGRLFSLLFYTQSVGPHGRGISPSQGRYPHTEEHKHRINSHRHPCLEWDSNPRFEFSSGRRRFMP
jgi:hypothetical protein